MLAAVQALALEEHRHFSRTEDAGGGRRLVGELALGLILDRWSVSEAAAASIDGHIGLKRLRAEKAHLGILPTLAEYLERLGSTGGDATPARRSRPESRASDEGETRDQALES